VSTTKTTHGRAAAIALGQELGREMAARTVLFHQAVAERLGLGATDHKCLDYALRAGRGGARGAGTVTAGELATLTGLTSGAITGVLDRLEKAGFVRREKDPGDRRQVLVCVLPDRQRELEQIFAPMARAWADLCSGYDDEQLALVQGFMRRAIGLLQQETDRLRASAAEAAPESRPLVEQDVSAPVERGHHEPARGAARRGRAR
jgi:DNA-binding MarR family transcriptional regulator